MMKRSLLILLFILLFPCVLHASIIESTIGTAVVNDATASYYNPAALTLLKNKQLITIGSVTDFNTHFNGQVTQTATHYVQTGRSSASTNYYLPSVYIAVPDNQKVTIGIAVIYNYFEREVANDAMLRYLQPNNRIQDINFVPALGFKLNDVIALGIGLNLTHVNFVLQPVSGFPTLGIADAKSYNVTSATSLGEHAGILLRPSPSTLIGFNYRSAITYQMTGESTYQGNPSLTSGNYNFKFWTPARSVLSINHFITPAFGLIGTVQYIQWNVFKNLNIKGIATRIISQPVIIPTVNVDFNLHNTWLVTFGGHYRVTPKWIIRGVGSYNQSAANGRYQLSDGDSFIVAVSTGYDFNKTVTLDGGYAYAFIKNQNINIRTRSNVISGVNKSFRDAISIKLTLNV